MKNYLILCNTPFKWNDIRSWGCLLVRLFTRSKWDHVARLVNVDGTMIIYESRTKDGVRNELYSDWVKGRNVEIYKLPDLDNLYRLEKHLGKRYGWKDIFRHIRIKLFGGWWQHGGVKLESEKMTCSEYFAYTQEITGWWNKTPKELSIFAAKNYELIYNSKDEETFL